MKTLIIAALSLFAATASAEPRLPRAAIAAGLDVLKPVKVAKPVVCQHYNVFRDGNGVEMGVCAANKAGGKATILRSFSLVKVVDPSTDGTETLMVGYR